MPLKYFFQVSERFHNLISIYLMDGPVCGHALITALRQVSLHGILFAGYTDLVAGQN